MIELKFFPALKIMINETKESLKNKSIFKEYFPNKADPKMDPIRQKVAHFRNVPENIIV